MGVNNSNIVIVGAKLNPNLHDYDKHEKWQFDSWKPKLNKLVLLTDPMSGKYFIAGHMLACTDNGRDGDADFGSKPIEIDVTLEKKAEVLTDIRSLGFEVDASQIKIYAVTEYT